MAAQKRKTLRPATTPEGRENQLVSLAYDLAEKRIRDGSASAQEVTHFLKAGSTRARLEEQQIQQNNLLLSAKVEQISSGKRTEELLEDAIKAMRQYSGQEPEYVEDDGYYGDR